MTCRVVILRPLASAAETAARASALGLDPVVAPLFDIVPLPWEAPVGPFDAVLMTSANAARHGGTALARFRSLPCYTVGEATAAAARAAGFRDVSAGPGDVDSLMRRLGDQGIRRLFHPCGRDRRGPGGEAMVRSVPVYASEARPVLASEARAALRAGAVALIHSPRAGSLFRERVRGRRAAVRLATISDTAARAAGKGWGAVAVAAAPTDAALLAAALELCQTGRR